MQAHSAPHSRHPNAASGRSSGGLAVDTGAPMPPRRRTGWAWRLGLERPDTTRLSCARLDFADAIGDVRSEAGYGLQTRIALARSLHDLWHLRAEAFTLISRRFDQAEANDRLASLNHHFA